MKTWLREKLKEENSDAGKISCKFNGGIPAEVREKIRNFSQSRDFDVKYLEHSGRRKVAELDGMWLLIAFDVTDAEHHMFLEEVKTE